MNEDNRFHNVFEHQKKHGLKYIPPPVAETVKHYLDDQKFSDLRKTQQNFLLNGRYAKKQAQHVNQMKS